MKKSNKEIKILNLASKGEVKEIESTAADYPSTLGRIIGNEETVIFKKAGNKLVRHGVYRSKNKAMVEERRLNKKGIKTVRTFKEKTKNQYDGIFIINYQDGNADYALGMDAALKMLNDIHHDDMHLRKQRTHKETTGYVAFGYNTKTNSFVCTRMYAEEDMALSAIYRRQYVDNKSVRCFRVGRYYKGFSFKHQDLDDCNRLKQAKSKLGE